MTPDVYTTTNDPIRPMVCASCQGHFAGAQKNLIDAKQVNEQVVVIALCDNCLRDIGAQARA